MAYWLVKSEPDSWSWDEQVKVGAKGTAWSGVLMIPSFSIERTQELLYEIDQLLAKDLQTNALIYLDSPMAIRATEIYRNFADYLRTRRGRRAR